MNRRALLQALIDGRFDGNQAAFARAIGRQPAQVNQYLRQNREIGDAICRTIEAALGIPPSYFDGALAAADVPPVATPGAPPISAADMDLLTALRALRPARQAAIIAQVLDEADQIAAPRENRPHKLKTRRAG